MAHKLLVQFDAELSAIPGRDRTAYCFDALWAAFSSPLFAAWLELTVASRTDDELRASLGSFETSLQTSVLERLQTAIGDSIKLGHKERIALGMTLYLFQGMSLARWTGAGSLLGVGDPIPEMLTTWKKLARTLFRGT